MNARKIGSFFEWLFDEWIGVSFIITGVLICSFSVFFLLTSSVGLSLDLGIFFAAGLLLLIFSAWKIWTKK